MSIKPQLNIDDLYETKKKNDLNKLELHAKRIRTRPLCRLHAS